MMPQPFADRRVAGQVLATLLADHVPQSGVIVLALPRGGVPVAFEIAQAFKAPLEVFLVRKLGVPGHAELAFGAVGSGGVQVINQAVVEQFALTPETIRQVLAAEQRELDRREQLYRGDRPPLPLEQASVIVVDDGLATGASMRAAITALRQREVARLIVAVPVAAPATAAALEAHVDALICPLRPVEFRAVGQWYLDFRSTSDAEVCRLLQPNINCER